MWYGRPTLLAFLGRIILAVLMLLIGMYLTGFFWIGWLPLRYWLQTVSNPIFLIGMIFFIIPGIAIIIHSVLKVRALIYYVTNMRAIEEYMLIGRSMKETTLDHVTDVVFHQGLFGRVFNFGTIHLHTAGTGFLGIDFVGARDPLTVRGTIINAKDAYIKEPRRAEAARYPRVSEEKRVVREIDEVDQLFLDGEIGEETYRKLKPRYGNKLERRERHARPDISGEKKRLELLVDRLDERLLEGKISEETYLTLKKEYEKRLEEAKK